MLLRGVIVADNDTVLLNPFVPVIIMAKVAVEPLCIVCSGGDTVIVKSGGSGRTVTVTVRVMERIKLPVVPVTVTWYVPASVALVVDIVRIALDVPPLTRVIFAGLRLVTSSAGVDVENRITIPVNPFKLNKLIVDATDEPFTSVRLVGLDEREKLGGGTPVTVRLTMTAWFTCPNNPLTVTVYAPGNAAVETLISRMVELEAPAPNERIVSLSVTKITGEDTVSESVTWLLNPFRLVRLIVELAEPPGVIVRFCGEELIVKSGVAVGRVAVMRRATEWTSDPLVPVTTAV